VLAAITKLGIDRGGVQTSGISLSRSQVPATRRHPAHKLYSASNDLTVSTTKISLVGPIVDAATQAGADSIDGPDFSFGDPSAGLAAATRAALADARSRADDAAAAIGYAVVGVQSVAIDPDESQTPEPVAADAAPEAKSPTPTPVDPGRQEVDATVDVVFLIAPSASRRPARAARAGGPGGGRPEALLTGAVGGRSLRAAGCGQDAVRARGYVGDPDKGQQGCGMWSAGSLR
jgi:hypothetical protein